MADSVDKSNAKQKLAMISANLWAQPGPAHPNNSKHSFCWARLVPPPTLPTTKLGNLKVAETSLSLVNSKYN